MNITKIIRASEWWEYKLPPMLTIIYATAIHLHKDLFSLAPKICIWLIGIIIGAVYVSVLNDLTDLKEDEASGKKNRLSKLSVGVRYFFAALPVLFGILFAYFLLSDSLSILMYAMCWLAFSLYSIPPFRFKTKGIWGVMMDASGAHLFPTLFLLSATIHFFHVQMDWLWFSVVGIWSFAYGLRGILWHQFFDRSNDLKVGLNTYASKKSPEVFRKQSLFILVIELMALVYLLVYSFTLLPFIGLAFYFLMLVGYNRIYKLAIIAIVPTSDQPWHLVMTNYYQFILPLSLLLSIVIINTNVWILIAAHFIIFPATARNTIGDMISFAKSSLKKIVL